MGWYNSTRIDEGRKRWILLVIEIKACTVRSEGGAGGPAMLPLIWDIVLLGGRARVVQGQWMGWKINWYKIEDSFSDKLHQQVITAVQWGYSDSKSPWDKSEQALIALIWVVGNMWLLYAGTRRFDSSYYVPNGFIFDALGTNGIDSSWGRAFCTNCGHIARFSPTRSSNMQENPRKC